MEAARKENNEQYNTVLRKVRFIIPLTKGLLIPPALVLILVSTLIGKGIELMKQMQLIRLLIIYSTVYNSFIDLVNA